MVLKTFYTIKNSLNEKKKTKTTWTEKIFYSYYISQNKSVCPDKNGIINS